MESYKFDKKVLPYKLARELSGQKLFGLKVSSANEEQSCIIESDSVLSNEDYQKVKTTIDVHEYESLHDYLYAKCKAKQDSFKALSLEDKVNYIAERLGILGPIESLIARDYEGEEQSNT